MRLALDRIDVQSLGLDLGTMGRVDIVSGTALRGVVDQTPERLLLEGFGADEVALRALALNLGTVKLGSSEGATLTRLGLGLEQRGPAVNVGVAAVTIAAKDLTIDAGDVLIRGKPTLSNAQLTIEPDGGSLAAEGLEAIDLVVKVAGFEIHAPALRAYGMRIGWGKKGFELTAEKIDAPGLRVRGGTIAVDAGALAVTKVDVGGGNVRIARIGLEKGALRATLSPATKEAEPPPARSGAPPLLDWCVLDSLSGKVDVDALVDVTVPIIGHRKATHAFRIPIENGAIDFRELEADLAALEDAVLDFAVRDGALVLERVNPLLPVRGRGKPIVVWNLDVNDLALADKNRVRLSVLPNAKPAMSPSMPPPSPEGGGKSSFALRELGLHRIDVDLTLAPVRGKCVGQLRPKHADKVTVEGQLVHTPDASSPPGRILGGAENVALSLHALALGSQTIEANDVRIGKLESFDIAFADIVPTTIQVALASTEVEGLALSPQRPTKSPSAG